MILQIIFTKWVQDISGEFLNRNISFANNSCFKSSHIYNGNWTELSAIWSEIKIERERSASSISNQKYDFRPKLHDRKFNCHFIRSILKSPNLIAKFAKQWLFVFLAMWLASSKSDWLCCFTVPFSSSCWEKDAI